MFLLIREARAAVFPPVPDWSSGPSTAQGVVGIGDFDNDGSLDLVLGDYAQSVTQYLNGGRTFNQTPVWSSIGTNRTLGVAVGDIDRDGDLDLACGNNNERSAVYLSENGVLPSSPSWMADRASSTRDLSLADLDGDGDLDLILGNETGPSEWFMNRDGTLDAAPTWAAASTDSTTCIAVGDMDQDGRLDLVCGNSGHFGRPLTCYRNTGETLESVPSWSSADPFKTQAIALGDVNGDGRLDLVCGTDRQGVQLYLNTGGELDQHPVWTGGGDGLTVNVVLGDLDGDADLDLVVGNSAGIELYLNSGSGFSEDPVWSSALTERTSSLALADINSDGALDLVCGNVQQSATLYLNVGIVFAETPSWSSDAGGRVTSVALADANGDGDIDLFAGNLDAPSAFYENDDGAFPWIPTWRSERTDQTRSIVIGDVDDDGRPDLICGNSRGVTRYSNLGETFSTIPTWSLDSNDNTTAVGLADIDGDRLPDLICGVTGEQGATSKLYLNHGGTHATESAWESSPASYTSTIALCDFDEDSRIDLVLGNQNQTCRMYGNDAGVLTQDAVWTSGAPAFTTSLAAGDVDGDGDDDLLIGNLVTSSKLFLSEGGQLSPDPSWSSAEGSFTTSLALGDVDGDGDLDLVCGNSGFVSSSQSTLYRNDGGVLSVTPVWRTGLAAYTNSICLGDVDEDGDLDLVCGNGMPSERIGNLALFPGRRSPPYLGDPRAPTRQLPFTAAYLRRVRVVSAGTNLQRVVFRAIDLESDPVWIVPEYQFEGDPTWRPVEPADGPGRLGPLPASPEGIEHTFEWDISRIPRDRRDAVLRLRTISHPQRVSVIRDVSTYLRSVGPITPIRGELSISAETIDFSTVTVGDTAAVSVTIANPGNATLSIRRITMPSSDLYSDPLAPLMVASGEQTTVTFYLAPRGSDPVTGAIEIESNDPTKPIQEIAITSDIRPLQISTRLLAPAGAIPLGEAVTVIVTPGPEVRLERGVLYHRSVREGPSFADSVALSRSAGDWIAVVPGSSVTETGLEYFIRVENSGIFASDPPEGAEAPFVATVAPPATFLSSPKPNSGAGYLEGRAILVEALLPQGSTFVSGILHYRAGGERTYRSLPLAYVPPNPSATIPDSCATARGMEYWISLQTQTRALTDPPDQPAERPRTISITIPDLAEASLYPGMSYRMVSIPLRFEEDFGGTLESLLSDQPEFGPYDPIRWRAFRYEPVTRRYRELSDPGADAIFRPSLGKAFWLIARDASRIATGPVSGFSVPTDSMAAVVLQPGWNQVGHPFLFPVAWEETEADTLGTVLSQTDRLEPPIAWSPETGYRLDVDVLEPFQGYWVRNRTDEEIVWRVPPRSATAVRESARRADRPDGGWSLRVVGSIDHAIDRENWIGLRADADAGWDPSDRSEPPLAPGRAIAICFPHLDWTDRPGLLAADYRPVPDIATALGSNESGDGAGDWGETWPVAAILENSAGPWETQVRVQFEMEGTPRAGTVVCWVDRQEGTTQTLDWNCVSSVTARSVRMVDLDAEPRYLILAGSACYVDQALHSAWGTPARSFLAAPHPNPTGGITSYRYGLARDGDLDLAIYDVRGTLVRRIDTGYHKAGAYRAAWDGRDDHGRTVASGIYFCHLRAPGIRLSQTTVRIHGRTAR